jgi:hypothetical protein
MGAAYGNCTTPTESLGPLTSRSFPVFSESNYAKFVVGCLNVEFLAGNGQSGGCALKGWKLRILSAAWQWVLGS